MEEKREKGREDTPYREEDRLDRNANIHFPVLDLICGGMSKCFNWGNKVLCPSHSCVCVCVCVCVLCCYR